MQNVFAPKIFQHSNALWVQKHSRCIMQYVSKIAPVLLALHGIEMVSPFVLHSVYNILSSVLLPFSISFTFAFLFFSQA